MDHTSTSCSAMFLDTGETNNTNAVPNLQSLDSFLNWDFEQIGDSSSWTLLPASDPLAMSTSPGSSSPLAPSMSSIPSSLTKIPSTLPSDPTVAVAVAADPPPPVNRSTAQCPCCGEGVKLPPGASFHTHVSHCFVEKQLPMRKEGAVANNDWNSEEHLRHVQTSISRLDLSTRLGMMESFYRLSKSPEVDLRKRSQYRGGHVKGISHAHGETSASLTELPITAKNNANDNGVLELLFSRSTASAKHPNVRSKPHKSRAPKHRQGLPISLVRATLLSPHQRVIGEDVLGTFAKHGHV